MNAIQPNPGERDADALRRAQRSHEPSMEEILASIRAIIADDRDALPPRPPAPPEPRIVYSNDHPSARVDSETRDEAIPSDPVAASTEDARSLEARVLPEPPTVAAPEPSPAPAIAPAPMVVWARPRVAAAPEPLAEEPKAEVPRPQPDPIAETPLLSDEAGSSVSASFEALNATVAMQNAELMDRLTREMLRPMIKGWLDEHLPSMVERMVRAEIQRVARGGK
jgi:cell pole-organizing protein PopZ